jgi:hypothetical protein
VFSLNGLKSGKDGFSESRIHRLCCFITPQRISDSFQGKIVAFASTVFFKTILNRQPNEFYPHLSINFGITVLAILERNNTMDEKLQQVGQPEPVTRLQSVMNERRQDAAVHEQLRQLKIDIEAEDLLINSIPTEGVEVRVLSMMQDKIFQMRDKLADRKIGFELLRLINIKGSKENAAAWLSSQIDSLEQ